MIVLDASIAFAFFFPDENSKVADQVFDLLRTTPVIVPSHWHVEIANGFLVAVRRKRMGADFRDGALARIAPMDIRVDDEIRTKLWKQGIELAEKHGLSAYDVAYLQLAINHRSMLATLDKKLAAAAMSEGIAVFGQNG